jgi:hypothetical protein
VLPLLTSPNKPQTMQSFSNSQQFFKVAQVSITLSCMFIHKHSTHPPDGHLYSGICLNANAPIQ